MCITVLYFKRKLFLFPKGLQWHHHLQTRPHCLWWFLSATMEPLSTNSTQPLPLLLALFPVPALGEPGCVSFRGAVSLPTAPLGDFPAASYRMVPVMPAALLYPVVPKIRTKALFTEEFHWQWFGGKRQTLAKVMETWEKKNCRACHFISWSKILCTLWNAKTLVLASSAPHQTCTFWLTFFRVRQPSFFQDMKVPG